MRTDIPILKFHGRTEALGVLAASLLLFPWAIPARASSCVPPASLASTLADHPTAESYAQLGAWFTNHGKSGCSSKAYAKAAELQPESSHYSYLLGLSLFSAGQTQQAVEPLRRSLQLDPTSLNPHLALATVLERTGNHPAAELQWRAALALDPHASMAVENLSRDLLADRNYIGIIEWLGPTASSSALTAQATINLSVAYTKSGLVDDAVSLLQMTLRAHPDSVPVVEALAADMVLQGRIAPAAVLLSKAAEQHPRDEHLQILRLRAEVLTRDPAAGPLVHRLLAQYPHQWELLYLFGLMRQQAGDFAGARACYQRSLASNASYPDTHFQLGVVLQSQGNHSGAKRELRHAIALGYDAPNVHFVLGRALHSLDDEAGARREFQRYHEMQQAESNETLAAAESHQGDEAKSTGQYEQAAAHYRKAMALDSKEPLLAYKLAMALDEAGDRSGERGALEQAIAIDPGMAVAQNQLGYLDSLIGDADSAVHQFQLAVQDDPGYSKAWMNLAAELCLQSKWQDARRALAHVLELNPSNATGRELLERLDATSSQQ